MFGRCHNIAANDRATCHSTPFHEGAIQARKIAGAVLVPGKGTPEPARTRQAVGLGRQPVLPGMPLAAPRTGQGPLAVRLQFARVEHATVRGRVGLKASG
jgi:hypothetical protein